MILAEPSGDGKRPIDPRQQLGREGEAAAEALLVRDGWRILARRFRMRFGELDLIAERGRTVLIVEVKTRSGGRYGRPAEAVTRAKQRRMARLTLAFLQRSRRLDRRVRFDVIEVLLRDGEAPVTNRIEDAFRPEADY